MSISTRFRIIIYRICGVLLKKRFERELEDEIRSHIEMQTADNIRQGMSAAEARYSAMRKFGGIEQTREKHRQRRGLPFVETTFQDLRYALRLSRKSPGFTVIAVLTLAIGIGANTAIFSVFQAVVLRPLPYKDADRLVTLTKVNELKWNQKFQYSSDFQTLSSQSKTLADLAVYYLNESSRSDVTFTGDQDPQTVKAGVVSANFFTLLGVQPVIGRFFTAEEDAQRQKLTLISYSLWQRRFASSPTVLGQTIQLNRDNYRVIGVMPAEFHMPARETQLWLPINSKSGWLEDRERLSNWSIISRLRDGVTLSQAEAELNTVESNLQAMSGDSQKLKVVLTPLGSGLKAETRRALYILFGAVLFVLFIACANVGSLMLARSAAREREFAVRSSLGGSRLRLFRQILTEGAVLSLVSAILGTILAVWSIKLLGLYGPADIPRLDETRIDSTVLLFTVMASFLAALFFSLAPAWKASRLDAGEVLKGGNKGAASGSAFTRVRNFLVIGEFTIALVLLTGAGLMIRSLIAVRSVNLGFRPDHAITMSVKLPNAALYDDLVTRIASDSRVTSVGTTRDLFDFEEVRNLGLRTVEGHEPESPDQWTPLKWDTVGNKFFQAMGADLLKGRYFSDQDTADTPLVAVVDEATAKRYWPNENPIGKRFKGQDPRGKNDDWLTVIGEVRNLRRQGLEKETTPHIFEWYKQDGNSSAENTIIVRTSTDPVKINSDLRAVVRSVSPSAVISKISSLEEEVNEQMRQRKFQTELLGSFSLVALLLSAIGIFGLMHYSVAQRTQEVGIRMALGAQASDVLRLVLKQGLVLTAIGIAGGLGGAFVLTRLMASILYGTSATDPATFVIVTALLLAISLIASYLPARRASKVDPMIALHFE